MSDNLKKAEDIVNKLKGLSGKSSWNSSKLYVMAAIVAGLMWLCRNDVSLIIWQISIIICTWLICRTVEDVVKENNKTSLKKFIIESTTKDGVISDEEKEVIAKLDS